jgi:hypothetical protein
MFELMDWIESLTTASNALEALRMLIDYHIERSPAIAFNISYRVLQFRRPVPEVLCSFLAPLMEKWATTFSPGALRGLAEYGVTKTNFIKFLTALFIRNISVILGKFRPGGGPVALLDSNYSVQVPCQVQVNDCVGQFIYTQETCANIILRPEPGKEDLDSHSAIRMALSSSDNVKHFKYVGFGGRLTNFNILRVEESRTSIICAIH